MSPKQTTKSSDEASTSSYATNTPSVQFIFSEIARVPRLDIATSTPDRWGTGDNRGKTKQTCDLAVNEILAPKESNLSPKSFLRKHSGMGKG